MLVSEVMDKKQTNSSVKLRFNTPSDQSFSAEPWSHSLSDLTKGKCQSSLEEHDYMGLSSEPSPSSSSSFAQANNPYLAMACTETELRLGIGPAPQISEAKQESAVEASMTEKTHVGSYGLNVTENVKAVEAYHLGKDKLWGASKMAEGLAEEKSFGIQRDIQCPQDRTPLPRFHYTHDMPPPADKISFDAATAVKQSFWQGQAFQPLETFWLLPSNQNSLQSMNANGLYTAVCKGTIPAKRGFLEALGSINHKMGTNVDSAQAITPAEGLISPKGVIHNSSSVLYPAWGNAIQVAKGVFSGMPSFNPMPGSTTWATKVQTSSCKAPSLDNHVCEGEGGDNASPPRGAVVGWPPIRSFRKNTLASPPKPVAEEQDKPPATALDAPQASVVASANKPFVKINMDGVPIGRKVDLKAYDNYQNLKLALQDMFQLFVNVADTQKLDLVNSTDYVLTYEDNVGDWMLVGDVPWEMFVSGVKRLRIMKISDAAGLGQRASMKPK